jgi:hypothetical protein
MNDFQQAKDWIAISISILSALFSAVGIYFYRKPYLDRKKVLLQKMKIYIQDITRALEQMKRTKETSDNSENIYHVQVAPHIAENFPITEDDLTELSIIDISAPSSNTEMPLGAVKSFIHTWYDRSVLVQAPFMENILWRKFEGIAILETNINALEIWVKEIEYVIQHLERKIFIWNRVKNLLNRSVANVKLKGVK